MTFKQYLLTTHHKMCNLELIGENVESFGGNEKFFKNLSHQSILKFKLIPKFIYY